MQMYTHYLILVCKYILLSGHCAFLTALIFLNPLFQVLFEINSLFKSFTGFSKKNQTANSVHVGTIIYNNITDIAIYSILNHKNASSSQCFFTVVSFKLFSKSFGEQQQ